MASSFKVKTSYPVSCISFQGESGLKLVVAGGGGSSRSGVKNTLEVCQIDLKEKTINSLVKAELKIGEDCPTSLSVHPEERDVIVCGINGTKEALEKGGSESLKLFKIEKDGLVQTQSKKGILQNSINDYQRVTVFSPNGKYIFMATDEGQVSAFNYPTLEPKFPSKSLTDENICDGDVSSDNKLMATVSDRMLHIFKEDGTRLTGAAPPMVKDMGKRGQFRCLRFGRGEFSNKLFVVVNAPNRKRSYLARFDLTDLEEANFVPELIRPVSFHATSAIAISHDGSMIALGCSNLSIRLINTETSTLLTTISDVHSFPVTTLTFDPQDKYLVSGSADSTICVTELPESFSSKKLLMICFAIALLLFVLMTGLVFAVVFFESRLLDFFPSLKIRDLNKDEL